MPPQGSASVALLLSPAYPAQLAAALRLSVESPQEAFSMTRTAHEANRTRFGLNSKPTYGASTRICRIQQSRMLCIEGVSGRAPLRERCTWTTTKQESTAELLRMACQGVRARRRSF